MALDEYKKKRNFKKTPEPEGHVKKAEGRERIFCVQKHLASHLHYDFRLEHNGTLLSWAVPKGPSLDPKTKRLAMKVEDHPIEYCEFEGVIPEGYGAGIVMLWDVGTWTPQVDDVDAALKKGDLKFTLNGYKLKGSWVLVRTSGRYAGSRGGGEGRTWLLIKHRDDWAGELDITEFAPKSIKSDGDFEDILAQDTPAVWLSNRPAKGGDAGAMLAQIIERAAKLKAGRAARPDTKDAKETKSQSSTERNVTSKPRREPESEPPAALPSAKARARRAGVGPRERREKSAGRGGGAPPRSKKR